MKQIAKLWLPRKFAYAIHTNFFRLDVLPRIARSTEGLTVRNSAFSLDFSTPCVGLAHPEAANLPALRFEWRRREREVATTTMNSAMITLKRNTVHAGLPGRTTDRDSADIPRPQE